MLFLWGLYEHISSHFVSRKFISITKHLVSEDTYEIISNLEGISSQTYTSISSQVFVLFSLKGAAKPSRTNWLVGNDMSNLVSETIRISMLPKTASDKSYILVLIEFMLIWLIRFFILNFFNVSLKLSSTDWQVIETDPLIFLDRLWEISLSLRIVMVFERSDATSEKVSKDMQALVLRY